MVRESITGTSVSASAASGSRIDRSPLLRFALVGRFYSCAQVRGCTRRAASLTILRTARPHEGTSHSLGPGLRDQLLRGKPRTVLRIIDKA